MALSVVISNNSGRRFLPYSKIEETARRVFKGEKIRNAELSVVLTSDTFIRTINKQYLNHDFATDVISFTLEDKPVLVGELYISVDTAELQAKDYGVSLRNELMRLTAHGTLHLCGYEDNSLEERKIMHNLEDCYITNLEK